MRPNATLACQLMLGLCGWSIVASAQTQTWSAVNNPDQPVYQDHLIGGGSLRPDVSAGDTTSSDDTGLARSVQIDAVASVLRSNGEGAGNDVTENGLIAKSQWETAAYGAWSLDASARTTSSGNGDVEQGQGGVVTLRQRAMPFDGGWQADNALGDLNAPEIGLARLQSRFYLPTGPMQGATTEWRGPSDVQLVAGAGQPGLYDGIIVPNFRTLSGSTATAGAEWSPTSQWTLGSQFIDAHNVNLSVGPLIDGSSLMTSNTGLVSAAWQNAGERIQMNLLDGQVSGNSNGTSSSNGIGGWMDGSIVQGRFVQNAGLFRLDPNITWGNQLITNDVQGGYYRLDYQSRQWIADVGVDEVHSVSGLGSDTTFLTSDARYQMSRDWGVGGVANVSRANDESAYSLQGYVDHINSFGSGRAQVDYASAQAGKDTTVTLDQNWSLPNALRLSTSASVERISGALINDVQQDSTVVGLAAFGGGQLTAKLGVEGNVRWTRTVQGEAAPGVSANVSLTYRISQNWQLLATYYDSQVGSWTPLTVVSPLTPPIATIIPAIEERGIFLTIRYQRSAGLHFAPLGGAPGAGAGEIAGIVYLDANNNGRFEAGEVGAANVTVVLDGRFSVQTDANGRFNFPVVATGHHVITVMTDNVPLPWTLLNGGRTEIEVSTRDRTDVAIPAQRQR